MNIPNFGGLSNWHVWNHETLNNTDIMVMLLYLMLVISVTMWGLMSSHRGTVEGFFLAGQNLVWCKIGASLFASSIGIVRFLTLAGSGASAGVVIGAIEWNAVFFLCALGWIFSPIYIKAEVVTMPEFLRKRFCSRRIQFLLSFLYLFFYIFHMLLVEICIGSMYLRLIWGLDTYLITIFLLLIAGACTITGGLVTVAYTDTLHATMISTGSVLVMTFALRKVGGFRNIVDNYFTAKPNITSEGNWTAKPECYTPRQDSLHIFRDVKTGDIPWPGLIFGVPIISLFHWCNNQIFVQRALAGKDMNHVKGGCVFCGFLKLLTMFSIVIPGMISRILFPDQIACVVPSECEKHCGNKSNCSFLAYPLLILELLPLGLRGFIMSTLWAALISSLTSAFNCSSTIFTMDIYTQMRPMATEKELMVTGRFFTMALVAVSITFLSVVHTRISEKLFEFMQVVSNYLAPPIAATFFLAIFSTRVTEQGAFWGLTCGLLIGFIRLMLELAYKPWSCSENSRCPVIICGVHYLYFTIFLFLISLLIIMIISTFTDPIPDKYLHRLCWSLRNSLEERVLLHTEILRRKSKPQVYSDIFLEERSCIWKIWSVFCGLELQETKCVIEVATKEKTDHDETKQKQIFEGIMFGDLILKDKSRRQERRKNSEKPSSSTWKNITSAIGIFLILVAVILHIFFL